MAKAASGAKSEGPDTIVRSAFTLAARLGWRHVTLRDIADEAKVSLAELYAAYPSKDAILAAHTKAIDAQVLAGAEAPSEEETVKDRLFDALMRRFDAMKPQRDGIAAILRDGAEGPVSMLCGAARLLRSMAWTLESVGVSASGPAGAIKAKGLLAVYLGTLRVWLRDDTEDLSRTMAALDKRLARAEQFAGTLFGGRRGRQNAPPPEAPPVAPA
ncbi:MAG: TetR/AcrR family transcriptional regulator [Alphaproteobacteria bacterium]|nr:TetR/AcrR family transcriptional regulator [Alphaproteobacteria bacterium]